jgi:hypothetical protein
MKKFIAAAAALLVSGACFAQAGTAIKEGAKATGDKVEQGAQTVAGAVTKEPDSTVHKAKAKYHKAKAAKEATEAEDAAKAAVK